MKPIERIQDVLRCQRCSYFGHQHIDDKCPFAPTQLLVPDHMRCVSEKERQITLLEAIRLRTHVYMRGTVIQELQEYCPHPSQYIDLDNNVQCSWCQQGLTGYYTGV